MSPQVYDGVPPGFKGDARPAVEADSRKRPIRSVAVFSLLFTVAYLVWRVVGSTIDLGVWWVSLPLFVTEVHNALGLTLYTLSLWSVDDAPQPVPASVKPFEIAVLIPTYNEPDGALLPSIAAAVALKPVHETWVLDDGKRPAVRKLAADLGARYLTRPTNEGAKAGNLNHALEHVDADIIAVLDADHVSLPEFLINTLDYFNDPEMAVVQTPQDFYNRDSFENEPVGDDRYFNEESVFYRVVGPGKNIWGAAFWCGTCALVRTEALRSVGSVATETLTEDIHTTIRMHKRGWKTVFHNEVLARGLAPTDAIQYMTQRNRWALGAMQLLRLENPITGKGLTPDQRLAYTTTLFGWFDSWRSFAYMVLPVAMLLTGASPIAAAGWVYAPFFLATLAIQFVALRLLARGYSPRSSPFSLKSSACRRSCRRRSGFSLRGVPERSRSPRRAPFTATVARFPILRLLLFLSALSALGLGWFGLTVAGLTPMVYETPTATIGAAFFATVNCILLVAAIRRIRSARFASERRASVRFDVDLAGNFAGARAAIADVSLTGALVHLSARDAERITRSEGTLAILGPDGHLDFQCNVQRRTILDDGRVELGLEFAATQRRDVARLTLWLFRSGAEAKVAPAPTTAAA